MKLVGKFKEGAAWPRSSLSYDPDIIEFMKDNDFEGKDKLLDIKRNLDKFKNKEKESLGTDSKYYLPAQQNFNCSWKQIEKFLKPKDNKLDKKIWKRAEKMLYNRFKTTMARTKIRSMDEILIDMTTNKSAGPLYRKDFKNKQEYIDSEFGKQTFNTYWDELSQLGNKFTLWGACNKDEIRDSDRVLQNKTRLMFPASPNHTFAGARLFQDQNDRLRKNREDIPIKIGLSRYGPEIHDCILNLENLERIGSSDGVGWDSNFKREAFLSIAKCRYKWLRLEDQTIENKIRIANWYGNKIEKYLCMPDGNIVIVEEGEGSGTYTTIDDNSFYHYLMYCYIWIETQDNDDWEEMERIWKFIITGDDTLFNNQNISYLEFMEKYDQFLQHEHNGQYEKIENVTFCGQKFKMINGRWICIPNSNRVLNSFFWSRKDIKIEEKMMKVCALRLHCYYDKYTRRICEKYYTFLFDKYYSKLNANEKKIAYGGFLSKKQVRELYFGFD